MRNARMKLAELGLLGGATGRDCWRFRPRPERAESAEGSGAGGDAHPGTEACEG